MLKLMTPLLLSSILFADNTPNLTQQLQNMEQEQANMLADFTKIKKKREIEELKAEKLEEERLLKVAEEKRLKKLKAQKEEEARLEITRQNTLREAEEAEKKRILDEVELLRKQKKAKKLEDAKTAEQAKIEARKKKAAAKKKKVEAQKRAQAKKKAAAKKRKRNKQKVKTKPSTQPAKKEIHNNSLDILNKILDE